MRFGFIIMRDRPVEEKFRFRQTGLHDFITQVAVISETV